MHGVAYFTPTSQLCTPLAKILGTRKKLLTRVANLLGEARENSWYIHDPEK